MTRREWLGAGVLVAAYLVGMLGHLKIARFFVTPRQSEWLDTFHWADFIPHFGLAFIVVLLIWQSWRAWHGVNRGWTVLVWLVWLLLVVLFDRWLIFNIPSYIHYFFYGALAYGLAWFHDPDRTRLAIGPIVFAVTLMGIADETLQYTWTTIAYSNYLDFNDFLLNMLSAMGGVWLFYGFSNWPRPGHCDHRRNQLAVSAFVAMGILAAGLLIMAHLGHDHSDPQAALWPIERLASSYGTWTWTPYREQYFVLDPVLGTALIIGLGLIVSIVPVVRAGSRSRADRKSGQGATLRY
jgi:hypothetical protein